MELGELADATGAGEQAPLRQTPLHGRHVAAGARMVEFAGFDMPVLYGSIVDEHCHVRRAAGLFDVSHMGELRVVGADALEFAQRVFTNDVRGMREGQVRYGLLCQEQGGVIDDVTLYREGPEEAFFCVNAASLARDLAWLREVHAREGFSCELRDESAATCLLAVQGPAAREIVESRAVLERAPRRWRFVHTTLAGHPVVLSRTGYTGEDGYEIYAASEAAGDLWDALLETGGDRLRPIGLGARDTLRTEMGYALYGHELTLETNPLEAGLARFVELDAGFVGASALAEVAQRGAARRLVGLLVEGRALPRPGYPILRDGEPVGRITSGTFGPSVERAIAMGYVPTASANADGPAAGELAIEIRGRPVPCEQTETPFYKPDQRRA